MLQDSRFENRKEENTFTQKYIFIYLYSFEGIWPGEQSGRRPLIQNHYTLREQRNEQPSPSPPQTKSYIFYIELDKVMKFSEK